MSYLSRSEGSEDPSAELELVIRAKKGEQRAFEMLFARYNRKLTFFLGNMVSNDAIGCELAQETFVKAWRHIAALQDPSRFVSWLYQIARRCAYDYLQSKEAVQFHLTVPLDECSGDELPLCVEGPELRVEQQELLRLALARVSSTYRECLVLSMFQHVPQRNIAEILHMKESSVSAYVKRGKLELRSIYRSLINEHEEDSGERRKQGGRAKRGVWREQEEPEERGERVEQGDGQRGEL